MLDWGHETMIEHDCIHGDDFAQLKQISGAVVVIQSDIADLKSGQEKQIETAAKTREGQARLEGRFDTLEKVILDTRAQQPQSGMSMVARITIAALAVVGAAIAVIAKMVSG